MRCITAARWGGRLALIAAFLFVTPALADAEAGPTSGPLPAFRLHDLNGKQVSGAQLKGRLTVLAFWRLKQPYSKKLIADLAKLQAEYKKVHFVTIVAGTAKSAEVRAALKQAGAQSFTVLLDPKRAAYGAFGVRVLPSTWFVDATGEKRFYYPSRRRDFLVVARANLDLLLGKIDAAKHAALVKQERAPAITTAEGGSLAGLPRYRFALRKLQEGRVEEAKEELRQAWTGTPPIPLAGVDLGLLLLKEGKKREAKKILSKAAELAPGEPRAIGAKGSALASVGKEAEAQPLLRQAVEKGAKDPIFFYDLGVITEKAGKPKPACRYFRLGLESALGMPTDPGRLPPQ